MGEPASDPDDESTAGPDAAGARGLGSKVFRSDAARAITRQIGANLAAGSPLFFLRFETGPVRPDGDTSTRAGNQEPQGSAVGDGR
jgi:hypothetical protein